MFDFNDQTVSISSETIETVIGSQTRFKGNVKTDKPIRIDGIFEGDIDSTNLVLISESGISVDADDNRYFFSEFGTGDGYRYACCTGENASPPDRVTEIDFYSLFNKLTAEAE